MVCIYREDPVDGWSPALKEDDGTHSQENHSSSIFHSIYMCLSLTVMQNKGAVKRGLVYPLQSFPLRRQTLSQNQLNWPLWPWEWRAGGGRGTWGEGELTPPMIPPMGGLPPGLAHQWESRGVVPARLKLEEDRERRRTIVCAWGLEKWTESGGRGGGDGGRYIVEGISENFESSPCPPPPGC
jgi:hypothetical protein